MTEIQKNEILLKARTFFKDKIAVNHKKNTAKLVNIKNFNVNPFLDNYLANFAFGDGSPESIARAMIYPRVLGTSITTSFGTNMQSFCNEVLSSYASVVQGIDIEFVDEIDHRRKYCQIKAGPQTINKDDIITIIGHFRDIKNLARTNQKTDLNPSLDCIVGVLYGSFKDLSPFYLKINEDYPVICGKDFWHRLTGDPEFYRELITAFSEVAVEMDSRELIESVVQDLAEQIRKRDNI